MYSSILDLQENYLLVGYQTCCPHKEVQFLYFAYTLFVNKFRLLTQITEVLKITQFFQFQFISISILTKIYFLLSILTKNRYFNIDLIINFKNTIR